MANNGGFGAGAGGGFRGGFDRLVADSDKLVAQSNEVRALASDMKVKFQRMEDLMNKTRNYWIGEAGDVHRQRYDEQKEDIEIMLRRIFEHPDDLIQISGVYRAMENNAVAASQPLPVDPIS